jgi:hypothetical protein
VRPLKEFSGPLKIENHSQIGGGDGIDERIRRSCHFYSVLQLDCQVNVIPFCKETAKAESVVKEAGYCIGIMTCLFFNDEIIYPTHNVRILPKETLSQ